MLRSTLESSFIWPRECSGRQRRRGRKELLCTADRRIANSIDGFFSVMYAYINVYAEQGNVLCDIVVRGAASRKHDGIWVVILSSIGREIKQKGICERCTLSLPHPGSERESGRAGDAGCHAAWNGEKRCHYHLWIQATTSDRMPRASPFHFTVSVGKVNISFATTTSAITLTMKRSI